MKRKLLILTSFFCLVRLEAQILQSEDFNSLPVGAIGTDATGLIPTNNYYTLSTNYDLDPLAATTATNASAANFQIVDFGGANGNVLQIEGTNGDKGRRNMWQGGLADQWAFRDAAHDRIQVEFDLFTGAGGGESNNTKGMYIYDSATDGASLKILGGFVFNTKTRILQGIGYYTSPTAPIANYGFFLGPTSTNITLPANEWVRLAVSFNKSTGQIIWKGPTFLGQVVGAATGLDPDKVALISRSGNVAANGGNPAIINTAATTAGFFDNLLVTANNIDLLGVNEVVATNFSVYAYPNPTKDFLTVSSVATDTITAITLTDVNGRIVRNESFNQVSSVEMNIADLSNGMYLMKITTNNGSSIQKIVKY
jgi:hypothetical protein